MHPGSAPFRWVWDQRAPNLYARGLVVSAATIELIYDPVRKLAASTSRRDLDDAKHLQHSIDKVVMLFRQKGCILPISDEVLVFVHTKLDFTIEYRRRDGTPQALGLLEKVVLATAIVGFRDQPLRLIDYDQPAAFAKLSESYGLRVETFPHWAHDQAQGVAS